MMTREEWIDEMRTAGALPCPTCVHVPQLRKHAFTTTMALALIFLYRRKAPVPAPAHVRTGDSLKKLEWWGLARRAEPGDYELTDRGTEVVLKRNTVPRYLVVAHGQALWGTGELIWIDEALNQRYSYEDLMREPS